MRALSKHFAELGLSYARVFTNTAADAHPIMGTCERKTFKVFAVCEPDKSTRHIV
jgi:hypothetical protein